MAKKHGKKKHPPATPEFSTSVLPNRLAVTAPAKQNTSSVVTSGDRSKGRPISEDEVRLCAYLKWESAGQPPGDGVNFWIEAERELNRR